MPPRAATIVPLPAPDADYRALVPVLKELTVAVDLTSTFNTAGRALQRLAPFDWLALCYRPERDSAPLLHVSLSGRPEWLATSQPLEVRSPRLRQWFLPETPRIAGPEGVPGARADASWPVPRDIGPLLTCPLPAGSGGQRRDAQRAHRRGALVLGRRGDRPFEPSLLTLLEPCVAHLVVLLERTEWLESFRAANAELRDKVAELQRRSPRRVRPVVSAAEKGGDHSARWVAVDPAGVEVLEIVERAAATTLPTLLHGESGTGKELLARTLHRMSERQDGPFVAVNVATLRAELAASELFGHVRGAFTDARDDRVGLIEEASGGTLFLDEIGDMPASVQPALLRFLEDGLVRPVGSNQPRRVDVRIVTATHRNLPEEVREGRFREDLFHRLAGVVIDVPALRDRPGDLLPLADQFLSEASSGQRRSVPASWLPALRAHRWNGNVRELRNALRAVAALSRGPDLESRFLPEPLRGMVEDASQGATTVSDVPAVRPPQDGGSDAFDGWTLQEVERAMIRRALKATAGHRGQAAARLGISPRALYDKIKRLGVTV